MAAALKDFFNRRVIEAIADQLAGASPRFDRARFIREALDGLAPLELIDRGWHIADAMARQLPASFPEAAKIVTASLGPPLPETDIVGGGMAPFQYLPHV